MPSVTATPLRSPRAQPEPAPRVSRAERAAQLVPCAVLLCVWLVVIPPSGGYFPRSWYPVALGTVLFFYVYRAAARAMFPAGRPLRLALVLFAALVLWAFLSIAWARSPGSAWTAADKLILVLAVAGVMASVRWTARSLALLLGGWSLGVALICAGRLGVWLGADDLSRFLE